MIREWIYCVYGPRFTSPDLCALGERIARRRELKGLTQAQLARLARLPRIVIEDLEQGYNCCKGFDLIKIQRALEMNEYEFWRG